MGSTEKGPSQYLAFFFFFWLWWRGSEITLEERNDILTKMAATSQGHLVLLSKCGKEIAPL